MLIRNADKSSPAWFWAKIKQCLTERRLPDVITTGIQALAFQGYLARLRLLTFLSKIQRPFVSFRETGRYLYASPVGREGKPFLEKIIRRFGCEVFDYMIFVYDDTSFDEELFKSCQIMYEKGHRCNFVKKYLTPEFCENYDYIFMWPDDIDIMDFDPRRFIGIMKRNNLENAQPALADGSYYTHPITLHNKSDHVGRFTDFVEHMVPVYRRDAWIKYWHMVEPDYNFWGWGYDCLAKTFCGYTNMGIIDSEPVMHSRPQRKPSKEMVANYQKLFAKFSQYKQAVHIAYGFLR